MAVLLVMLPVALAEELNLVYDANGNLISGDGFVREYDGFNQLVRVKNDSGSILEEFVWHPIEEKILIKKVYNSSGNVAQRIVYINENTIKIKNSSGTFYEHYVYQDGQLVALMDASGNKQFLHPDHLGSTSLMTSATGAVIENTFYSPFGEIINGGKTSRFDYEGKEFDEKVNDVDFHFRKYRPDWGRFTQPDTLIQNVYDPQSLNRYSFERNNPQKYVDPDGHILIAFYIAWKVWGAYLSLVPVGMHITDPNSVSMKQLGAAVFDTIYSLIPVLGDVQTAVNSYTFFSDPIEYLTNPDAAVSPGSFVISLFSGSESSKKVEQNMKESSTPQNSKKETSGIGTPNTKQTSMQADSSKNAVKQTQPNQGSTANQKQNSLNQYSTGNIIAKAVNVVKETIKKVTDSIKKIFKKKKK